MRKHYGKALAGLSLVFGLISGCVTVNVDMENVDPRIRDHWKEKLLNLSGRHVKTSAEPNVHQCSKDITVLSYNIRGIPFFEGRDTKAFNKIGKILAQRREEGTEPDIVLLQEAYSDDLTEKIRKRAGYPYQITKVGHDDNILVDNPSGLNILSNYKLGDAASKAFRHADIVESLVSKSVLAASVDIPDIPEPFYIINTHLQAGSFPASQDYIRFSQIEDISNFYADHNLTDYPSILACDCNSKPKHESYYNFLDRFPAYQDAGAYCLLEQEQCDIEYDEDGRTDIMDVWKNTNDRQFFTESSGRGLNIKPIELKRNFTQEFKGESLSDHWGYEVKYRLSWDCGIVAQTPNVESPPPAL